MPLSPFGTVTTKAAKGKAGVIAAAVKYGPLADANAKKNGFKSGAEMILKLVKGESNFNPNAVSSAQARGYGQFIPSTRASFLSKYNVDAWSQNPDQAIKAVALYLRDLGIEKYNPGMPTYISYIKGQDIGDLDLSGAGGLISGALGDGLDLVPDALDAASEVAKFLIDHLTHPAKLAALIAKVYAYVLRFIFRALWEYVGQPLWGWVQRATTYYFNDIMSFKKGESNFYYTYAGIITTAFWSLGFTVLYMQTEESPTFARPKDTVLGRGVRSAQIEVAKKNLTKPKDVKKKTPKKPDEETSSVEIDKTRELKAKRGRPVKVTGATDAPDAPGSETGTTEGDENERSNGRTRSARDKRRREAEAA